MERNRLAAMALVLAAVASALVLIVRILEANDPRAWMATVLLGGAAVVGPLVAAPGLARLPQGRTLLATGLTVQAAWGVGSVLAVALAASRHVAGGLGAVTARWATPAFALSIALAAVVPLAAWIYAARPHARTALALRIAVALVYGIPFGMLYAALDVGLLLGVFAGLCWLAAALLLEHRAGARISSFDAFGADA